jgi:hypothetical protein
MGWLKYEVEIQNVPLPCEYKVKEIDNENEMHSQCWSYAYMGFKRFTTVLKGWLRR